MHKRTKEEQREIDQELARRKKELQQARKAKKERVSYIKKPFAKRSFLSLGTAIVALLLAAAGIYEAVVTRGQAALSAGALGFCSILFCIVSLWYGMTSFMEKEANYILAKISMGIGGLLLFAWLLMIVI